MRGGGVTPRDRLLALLNSRRLSPTQRRIGQYLLDNMPKAGFLSSVDLAERAGVSQPSVTRFAVALGFSGYPELREALHLIALGATVAEPAGAVEAGNALQAAVEAEIANLTALRDRLADPTQVRDLGRELATSVPLVVLGTRISAPLAGYFGYGARRIHPDVRLVTGAGSGVAEELLQARSAGGGWVLAFAMPRYPTELVWALRRAREIGLRTAVLADVPMVPFAGDVDVLLYAAASARLVFDSYAAPAALAAVLLQAMADAEPARTRQRLDTHEELAERHGFFTTS
ncbi:MAG TPA: MurR/RpiR family transcriptional regulator [Rugosimonospora sp.]|nr:MurR/RpiR family transcriptional regulator [Rugosimonospora sp.]